jgi:signal transduction histidine kinase
MEALAEQLLDSARIREVGVELAPEEMSLNSAVEEVSETFCAEARRVRSPVECAAPVEIRGRWDRVQLKHVVANLLCNALRFGAGSPVRVELRDLGSRVSIVVTDQGIGVDPADHERIFERYGRVVSSRHFGGLGLGLWVTKQIVLKMGGSITVASERGRGATFTVDLPKGMALPKIGCL